MQVCIPRHNEVFRFFPCLTFGLEHSFEHPGIRKEVPKLAAKSRSDVEFATNKASEQVPKLLRVLLHPVPGVKREIWLRDTEAHAHTDAHMDAHTDAHTDAYKQMHMEVAREAAKSSPMVPATIFFAVSFSASGGMGTQRRPI